MDEARESQEMPAAAPLPLQYATRIDAADALRAYRLVGTALLLYYCGAIVGACMTLAGYHQMGIATWAIYVQSGVGVLVDALGLAGAICMTQQLRAGAWLIVAAAGLRIGVQCLYFLVQAVNMRSSQPGAFLLSAGAMTGNTLRSAAVAFLAYLLWDHCRKRGAWG